MSEAADLERFQALGDLLQRGWPSRSPVAWVAGPWLLAEAQGRPGIPYREPEALSSRTLRRERRRSDLVSLVDRPLRGLIAGDALLLPATLNQERVLKPAAARLGAVRDAPRVRGSRRRASALGREAIEAWLLLREAMAEAAVTAPWPAIGAVRTLLASARFLAYAEAMLAAVAPSVVVLGSMHNGAERAFAHTARPTGIPTVYLPHAPALTETRINDLAVDYAGLRGHREVELFAELGADPERLEVTGDPAIGAEPAPEIDPSLPPVLAVSPGPRESLRRQIELVRAAAGERVILSPHPRSDRAALRETAPPGWQLSEGLTHELLLDGPPTVIQRSSGVSLEALALGIPVIQISFPGERPGYPLIREPWVRSASSAEELRRALEESRRTAGDEAARSELIDWARQWAWPLGDEAADAAAALIRRAADEGPRAEPIWDAWGGERRP